MVGTIILCVLCAVGLLALVFLLAAAILLPVRDNNIYMLILASGNGERLEQQSRAYLLLHTVGLLRRPLLIADNGLTKQGRAAARQLVRSHTQIQFCTAKELGVLLHTER